MMDDVDELRDWKAGLERRCARRERKKKIKIRKTMAQ